MELVKNEIYVDANNALNKHFEALQLFTNTAIILLYQWWYFIQCWILLYYNNTCV